MDRINDLEKRLATLERTARRYRTLAAGLGLLIVVLAGIAAVPQQQAIDLIQARRLEILDAEGNLVLRAGSGTGGGQLDVWTPHGQNIVRLTGNDFGGDLAMWSVDGVNVYGAFATGDGGETALWNTDGARVMRAHANQEGGRLDLHNRRDQPIWSASVSDAGGKMQVANPAGQAVVTTHVIESAGSLVLNNAHGAPVVVANADSRGTGRLDLADADGNPRVTSMVSDTGGVSYLRNTTGTTVATIGAATKQSGGAIELAGEPGRTALRLDLEEGGGRLDVRNRKGHSVFTVRSPHERSTVLSLNDAAGRKGVVIAARQHGAALNLFNTYGSPIVAAGPGANGRSGAISIMNERGVKVVVLDSAGDESGQVRLYGADGRKQRAVLPHRKSVLDQ